MSNAQSIVDTKCYVVLDLSDSGKIHDSNDKKSIEWGEKIARSNKAISYHCVHEHDVKCPDALACEVVLNHE